MNAEQLRAGRGMLRWSQKELSDASGVSVPTIKRLEAMDGDLSANASTIRALERAMTDAGLIFIPANGGGAGVRLANS